MPPAALTRHRHERGSALLLAVVIVLILGVVGIGIVNRATGEMDAVGAKRHYDQSVSCADTAREYLMSQFSAYGLTPTQLEFQAEVGGKTLKTGHYDTDAGVAVKSVVVSNAAGRKEGGSGATDASNRMVGGVSSPGGSSGGGAQVYRMTVVCTRPAPSGGAPRTNEVEFLVRFGL